MKTVVKYNNRKLYDKEQSKYINLKELVGMELGTFRVMEKQTGNDVTINTLLSYLSNDFDINSKEYKLKVMKYCIELLSDLNYQESKEMPKKVFKKVVTEFKEEEVEEPKEEKMFSGNFWDSLK